MTPRIKVLFRSAFRGGLCISHETLDRVRTLCGRDVATAEEVTEETERDMDPDCRTCCKRLEKLRRASPVTPEPHPSPEHHTATSDSAAKSLDSRSARVGTRGA